MRDVLLCACKSQMCGCIGSTPSAHCHRMNLKAIIKWIAIKSLINGTCYYRKNFTILMSPLAEAGFESKSNLLLQRSQDTLSSPRTAGFHGKQCSVSRSLSWSTTNFALSLRSRRVSRERRHSPHGTGCLHSRICACVQTCAFMCMHACVCLLEFMSLCSTW